MSDINLIEQSNALLPYRPDINKHRIASYTKTQWQSIAHLCALQHNQKWISEGTGCAIKLNSDTVSQCQYFSNLQLV